jgi:hypothetical protein
VFNIYLTNETVPESDGWAVYGKIEINGFAETFVASLVSWTRDDYESQWRRACRRLLEGANESVLIASYVDPSVSEFCTWWPLYREGEIVHVQNQLLLYSNLSFPFNVSEPWHSLGKRESVTDDGEEISEWDTTLDQIQQFSVTLRREFNT